MKYVSQGPLMVDVHMHKPQTNAKNFMDALLAFWPGLQVWSVSLLDVDRLQLLYNHMDYCVLLLVKRLAGKSISSMTCFISSCQWNLNSVSQHGLLWHGWMITSCCIHTASLPSLACWLWKLGLDCLYSVSITAPSNKVSLNMNHIFFKRELTRDVGACWAVDGWFPVLLVHGASSHEWFLRGATDCYCSAVTD